MDGGGLGLGLGRGVVKWMEFLLFISYQHYKN